MRYNEHKSQTQPFGLEREREGGGGREGGRELGWTINVLMKFQIDGCLRYGEELGKYIHRELAVGVCYCLQICNSALNILVILRQSLMVIIIYHCRPVISLLYNVLKSIFVDVYM